MPGNLAVVIQAKLMSQSPRMRPGKHQAAPLLKLLLHSYDDMMTTIRIVIITTKINGNNSKIRNNNSNDNNDKEKRLALSAHDELSWTLSAVVVLVAPTLLLL